MLNIMHNQIFHVVSIHKDRSAYNTTTAGIIAALINIFQG